MNFKEFLEIDKKRYEGIGIQANCSEATVRINITGQDRKNIDSLIDKLQYELGQSDELKDKEWDDDGKEFEFSEGYVSEKKIFGVRVLEISGDAPYNFGEEIVGIIRKYLPKAKIEWED